MPVKANFGPPILKQTRRWGGDGAGSFRAPQQDPCLLAAFETAKSSNKSLVDASSAVAASSGAAAHAILSASETIENCIAEFEKIAPTQEGGWKDFFLNAAASLKEDVLSPLNDAVKLQAASYGRSIAVVRNGVIAAAEKPVKAVLKAVPPSDGFFFGDPADRLTSTMGYALMSAQLTQASRGRRGSAPSTYNRASSSRATTTPASATKKSTPASSSSSTRPFPRGRGGKGKK